MKITYLLILSLTIVACSREDKPSTSSTAVAQLQSEFSVATIKKGSKVYKANCAVCHGANAEGADEWRKRKANGKLKPPPLNGTGHTWHHSKDLLLTIIANGTAAQGGEMPAWGNKLSKDEMEAVLIWVQSQWPKETYQAWLEINNR